MVIEVDTEFLFKLESEELWKNFCKEISKDIKSLWSDRDKYDKKLKRKKDD